MMSQVPYTSELLILQVWRYGQHSLGQEEHWQVYIAMRPNT
jgi:hypothetical protein